MDGRVICFGATGHTCVYTPGGTGEKGSWVQGPDLPVAPNGGQLTAADVLQQFWSLTVQFWWWRCRPGTNTTMAFVEYDPAQNTCSIVAGAPTLTDTAPNSYQNVKMLLLPNGHGLVSVPAGGWYDVAFSFGGEASWAPTIASFPGTVFANSTVTLSGTQLCGLSECSSYGDDNQQAENYPMVRVRRLQGRCDLPPCARCQHEKHSARADWLCARRHSQPPSGNPLCGGGCDGTSIQPGNRRYHPLRYGLPRTGAEY
jgi:hypothetical protein